MKSIKMPISCQKETIIIRDSEDLRHEFQKKEEKNIVKMMSL